MLRSNAIDTRHVIETLMNFHSRDTVIHATYALMEALIPHTSQSVVFGPLSILECKSNADIHWIWT